MRYTAAMLVEVETALRCDEAFNILDEAAYCDEILDDDRTPYEELVRRAAHATWVDGYLTVHDRKKITDLLANYRPLMRWRVPIGGNASTVEAVSPGVERDLQGALDAELAEFKARADADPGLWQENNGRMPWSRDAYIDVAKEGLLDWFIRTGSPAFELRRCLYDDKWFVPQRAGRGKFCSDMCRSRFNMPQNGFNCAMCQKPREAIELSGLSLSKNPTHTTPYDIELGTWSWRMVCTPCILEHRPAWRRYVTTVSPRERTRLTR